ncbi:MAG: hypothetical protein ACQES1_10350 [Bacteroidota bacterium]
MKKVLYIFIILSLQINVFAQKSIEIENKKHAGYEKVPGTAISIVPPKNYTKSERFHGFENKLAGASIMVYKTPGSIQKNLLAFKKNKDIREGMVVSEETMYKINGYQALLQSGIQMAHGKTYMRYNLVIGDMNTTYLLNASWLKDDDAKAEAKKIKRALLSVIYEPEESETIEDAYNFTVDNKFCDLKPGNILMTSLVYSDDGNMPSQTDEKTIFMINKSTVPKGETPENYLNRVLKEYPLEFMENQEMEPEAVEVAGLKGSEIYGIGQNTKMEQPELLYIMILFDGTTVYQLTGSTLKYFEEHLACFKKTARSFRLKEE